MGTCPAGRHWRWHPQPSSQLEGPLSGADGEHSVACHGMVFSMDFQETKKETKSKRKKKLNINKNQGARERTEESNENQPSIGLV